MAVTGEIISATGTNCGGGTSNVFQLGTNLVSICTNSQFTLYTYGAFAIGKTLYTNSTLTTVLTGYTYALLVSSNIIYTVNSTTGVVLANSGNTCGGTGTAGNFITGSTLTSICGGSQTTLYTNGAFGVGKTLYTTVNLLTAATGFSYVVNLANDHIFNVNSGTGVVGTDTGYICGSGTSGAYLLSNTLTAVCGQSAVTLYTSGSFAVGKILYLEAALITPLTGYIYAVANSNSHIYNINTSTGSVTSDTGYICNSGTSGTYRVSSTLTNVCSATSSIFYTNGAFATGKILYYDDDLISPVTGYTYVVRLSNQHIYSMNSVTGLVAADLGYICNSGTVGTYIVGNVLGTVCDQSTVQLYTSGAFGVGKTLYTDDDLITPLTGYDYAIATSNSHIYNINDTTGAVVSDTGNICGSGTLGNFRTGNTLTTVCDQSISALYTSGSFAVSKILYTDINLIIAATGFSYAVNTATNTIYSVNSGTGSVTADLGYTCNSGVAGTYRLGNSSGTVCAQTEVILYTSGSFAIGKVLYTDNDLITIQTGYIFVVNTATNIIYNLDTSTGVVGAATGGTCAGGTAGTYKTGNSTSTICGASNTTLYTSGSFTVGSILYTDISLITPATGFSYVVRVSNSFIYSVNSGTGAVVALVGVCNGGTSNSVKLGNSLSTVCDQSTVTVYTSGIFGVGAILYSDINITTPVTGYTYVVYTATNGIYNLNTSTGVVGSDTGSNCASGTAGTYKTGNSTSSICGVSSTTLYTSGSFTIGGILYTNMSLTTIATGFSYVVQTSNNYIYSVNSGTGQIGAQVGVCNGGTLFSARVSTTINSACASTLISAYTIVPFAVGAVIYADVNITTILTGYNYIVVESNGRIYTINSSTGAIVAYTGNICGSGTSESYKTGGTSITACSQSTGTYYTDGGFAEGKILYSDAALISAVTGVNYIVRVSTNVVYAINSSTGVIGSPTGIICGSGVSESYRLQASMTGICDAASGTCYTSGGFAEGKILYSDINLTTPITGYSYVVRVDTGIVYSLDSGTGEIGSQVGVCGDGIFSSVRLGNNLNTICNEEEVSIYTAGALGVDSLLYEDENLTTVLQQVYLYLADTRTGYIYTLYNSYITEITGSVCDGGIMATYIVGTNIDTVCSQGFTFNLFTLTEFAVGVILYTDDDLIVPLTGYTYVVNTEDYYIYTVNSTTGRVLRRTTSFCNAASFMGNVAEDAGIKVAKYIQENDCGCGNNQD